MNLRTKRDNYFLRSAQRTTLLGLAWASGLKTTSATMWDNGTMSWELRSTTGQWVANVTWQCKQLIRVGYATNVGGFLVLTDLGVDAMLAATGVIPTDMVKDVLWLTRKVNDGLVTDVEKAHDQAITEHLDRFPLQVGETVVRSAEVYGPRGVVSGTSTAYGTTPTAGVSFSGLTTFVVRQTTLTRINR